MDYINICLSYPYVEVQDENDPSKKSKRYLLFYRWVQWSFLVMAALYYVPRKFSKNMENPKCKKLLEEFAANSSRSDPQAEQQLMEKVTLYMKMNIRTHNGLYVKFFVLNVVALGIDIFAMQYFNFLLQGRFIRYGFDAYPFQRDPERFTDYMSQMFPPFALCTLDRDNQLVNKRNETFGCHLTIMELYEKVFLFLWVWLIILTFLTSLYIVLMLLVLIPKVREYWLRTSKPLNALEKANVIIARANNNCKIGDIYFLYRLKGHMSHARFYELLFRLGDAKLSINKTKNIDGLDESAVVDPKHPPSKQVHGNHMMPQHAPSEARNRRPQPHSITPPVNPDFLNQMYNNPDTIARHGQVNEAAQRTPLLNKNNANTSILIE